MARAYRRVDILSNGLAFGVRRAHVLRRRFALWAAWRAGLGLVSQGCPRPAALSTWEVVSMSMAFPADSALAELSRSHVWDYNYICGRCGISRNTFRFAPRACNASPKPLKRVKAGEVLTAETINAIIDRVDPLDYLRGKASGEPITPETDDLLGATTSDRTETPVPRNDMAAHKDVPEVIEIEIAGKIYRYGELGWHYENENDTSHLRRAGIVRRASFVVENLTDPLARALAIPGPCDGDPGERLAPFRGKALDE
jgi:hypothetical protein